MNFCKHYILVSLTAFLWTILFSSSAEAQTTPPDSNRVKGVEDRYGDEISNPGRRSPWDIKPSNVNTEVEMTRDLRTYTIEEKLGDSLNYRPKSEMNFQDFAEYQRKKQMREYWDEASATEKDENRADPELVFKIGDRKDPIVEIRPSGNVTLDFGGRWQRTNNPAVPIRQQRTGGFEFDQQIGLNLLGNIGDRVNITANWDTKATFDFDNSIKVSFIGKEEDIIKDVQAGNVSMPIDNSLITGARNLFGIKTKLQFGKLGVTTILSNQRGKTETITIRGGAMNRDFSIRANEYDYNRHFFLGHYFRDNLAQAFESRPDKPTNGITITRVQVYITNLNTITDNTRNVIGFMDLGEPRRISNSGVVPATDETIPFNDANNLMTILNEDSTFRRPGQAAERLQTLGFAEGSDYQVINNARKLDEKDFTFHPELGYISLVSKLKNNEALAVAFEYTTNSGENYKVGELNEDNPEEAQDLVVLKLLKPNSISPQLNTWDLMMKNIYSLNTSNVSQEGFQLRVIYEDDFSGKDNPNFADGNEAVQGTPILRHIGLDRLNRNGDFMPDGNFDFIENATINTRRGYVVFPHPEPFGSQLDGVFEELDPDQANILKNKYSYDALYSETQYLASFVTNKNKFLLKGTYQSSNNTDIMLPGINIAEGSVVVTSGSITLIEGADYTVDYNLGRVKITNDGVLNSGKDIKIKYEKSDLFSFRTKSLVGTRLDYKVRENFDIGGTVLHMNERPLITRVNIGDEPIKNTQIGFDMHYKDESRLITKMVDFLPVIQTKAKSNVAVNFEVATLLPGSSRILQDDGTAYLDDFEGAETPYDFSRNPTLWRLGSTPARISTDYQQSGLEYGYHRGKMAWYSIDRTFFVGAQGQCGFELPEVETDENADGRANHYVRQVFAQEVFPGQQPNQALQFNTNTFDLAFYPQIRGQYNYNVNPSEVNADGTFLNPEDNFASITRAIQSGGTDFTKSNIEYIEFWMMNPFHGDNGDPDLNEILPDNIEQIPSAADMGGKLYFNLGTFVEDIMRDGQHGFENGLPENVVDSEWGRSPTEPFIINAFDNAGDRNQQDVGLDGIGTAEELNWPGIDTLLSEFSSTATPSAPWSSKFLDDPASDDFEYYVLEGDQCNDQEGILTRYFDFNNTEGNSPINSGNSFFIRSSYNTPDNEDLNDDKDIRLANEEYFEYEFDMRPVLIDGGGYGLDPETNRFITQTTTGQGDIEWYQVRIPIRGNRIAVGDIADFTNIQFFRMYLTGFRHPVVIRMAQLQLVGSQWQRYTKSLDDPDLAELTEAGSSNFNFSTVNIEENGQAETGISSPYRVPPGVVRDQDQTTQINRQLNEQALNLCVDELGDGEANAVMKLANYGDLINYKRLRLFIHAESPETTGTEDGDLTAFVRLGKDDDLNYYEIEVPLVFSDLSLGGSATSEDVWLEDNWIDLELDELSNLKQERDGQDISEAEIYSKQVGRYTLRIKGRPNRAEFNTWLLGIRNPKKTSGSEDDDGLAKTACVWFNELRVTGFDKFAGWATRGDVNMNLADLGNLQISGGFTSAGYGDIESKIADRTRESTLEYGISTNLALDKFIPKNKVIGIKLPLHASVNRERVAPMFNPFDQDVLLRDELRDLETQKGKAARDSLERITTYNRTIRSVNLSGVQLVKVKDNPKKHFYDPHNITVSAGYSEETRSGAGNAGSYGNSLSDYLSQTYKGSAGYNYSPKGLNIEPFKKSKSKLLTKRLRLIKDINLNPIPSSVSLRGSLNRLYTRTDNSFDNISQTNYEKNFTFDRNYSLKWKLTKSINVGFDAKAHSIVDEPFGDKYGNPELAGEEFYVADRQAYQDSIRANLARLGRVKNYSQNVNASYRLPLSKIKLVNWASADVSYKAGYTWTAAAIGLVDSNNVPFGNDINNTNNISLNGKVNMVKLYNKSKYLKSINSPKRKPKKKPKKSTKDSDEEEAEEEEKEHVKLGETKFMRYTLRTLMMVRNVNGRFGITNGLSIPGFLPNPDFMGMEGGLGGAPGLPVVFGSQDLDAFKRDADANEWLTESVLLNAPIRQTRSEDLSLKSSVEPFEDFRIQLDAKRSVSRTYSELYRDTNSVTGTREFEKFNAVVNGNVNMTHIAILTSFQGDRSDNSNEIFDRFSNYRTIFQERLNEGLDQSKGRYGLNSQDVLIPAFLAAYTGQDVNTTTDITDKMLNKAPKIPLPNWRIDYAGLSRLPKMRKKFSSFSIRHAYSSKYEVSSFTNSLEYQNLDPATEINSSVAEDLDTNGFGEFVPLFLIESVRITERFSPLLGINIRTKSKINFGIDYNRTRNLALSLNNAQITEERSQDFTIRFAWTTKNFKTPFRIRGEKLILPNNLTFKMDLSVRDTKTVQRSLETPERDALNEVTAGNINFQLRPNITYEYSKRLNLQLFFERSINEPRVSSSFRRASTRFGIQLRFSLA